MFIMSLYCPGIDVAQCQQQMESAAPLKSD
jgi:hypothetical protein